MSAEKRLMYINGEWVDAQEGRSFDVYNPATGEVCFEVADAKREDMARAVACANAAKAEWAGLAHTQRGALLSKVGELLLERQADLAGILCTESGSWMGKCMFETGYCPNILRMAAATTYNSIGEIIPSEYGKLTLVVNKPLGTIGVISPWNFPLLLSLRGLAMALAAGNTVVHKPSEETPVSGGLMIAELFDAAGFPKGVFNVVTCSRDQVVEVGDELVSNPGIDGISFTGSTAVGKQIAAKCGGLLKKACMELGGKDPLIVLDDADLDRAIDATVFGAFMHQGQICMSAERILVHESVADEMIKGVTARAEALNMGDPTDFGNIIGPIINQKQLDNIHSQVTDAVAKGAKIHTGGEYEGLFYRPTVISSVTRDMRIFTDETFGPVAPFITFSTDDEALEIANDSDYGLSAGIITRDEKRGLAIAQRLHSGMAHINDCPVFDEPHMPFGGVKNSGMGRHGGKWAIDSFTEPHLISLERGGRNFPF
ncbi:MAG: aldehyde dehydrogenase family protein [Xanthomonadales bacterium]